MKKCPRCGKEVRNSDRYCPHCGFNLQTKYTPMSGRQNRKTFYLYYIVLIFSMMSLPMLYSYLFNGIGNNLTNNPTNQPQIITGDLPEMINAQPTAILASFDSLDQYQKQYSNVSTFITNIKQYEETLLNENVKSIQKEYNILVLNNYNVTYKLTYTIPVSDQSELKIVKEFDRQHSYNKEKITYVKKGNHSFEELIFNEDDLNFINIYIDDMTSIQKVVDDFSKREDEFKEKKDKLGHYGLGTYLENVSFVVERYEQSYTSILTYQKNVQTYLG